MKLIYIQTLKTGKKVEIPFRIIIRNDVQNATPASFLIRPEISIPRKKYDELDLDRMELLAAPPFCDIADELIDLFRDEKLIFSERKQFSLLKSQFKTIGYNFQVRPGILCNPGKNENGEGLESTFVKSGNENVYGLRYGELIVEYMASLVDNPFPETVNPEALPAKRETPDLSGFKPKPGVYYFLDAADEVIYVGKAKNIRKRLGSHFSNRVEGSNIDYRKVRNIHVEYTGDDIIAQLLESHQIKTLKPVYNTQQVNDSAPFIINRGETASGIYRLKITRKDIRDNMRERYFNRLSVKESLEKFCSGFKLCRKHCGLETVKGPCSNHTVRNEKCVCAGGESIDDYNRRFAEAFSIFENRKSRKVYKLKGRSAGEDAFVYTVNGIYEGYGFIGKEEVIRTENDLLGYLISMPGNYDTSRIISGLPKKVHKENILVLE